MIIKDNLDRAVRFDSYSATTVRDSEVQLVVASWLDDEERRRRGGIVDISPSRTMSDDWRHHYKLRRLRRDLEQY